ncbi:glycosyltransferase family 2 protein [Paenibacillus thalictri]|uniref:Glycosyltransferase family 2 protein n=2 Tax=Paenibacillus thalictri TaxID=2527873 RepID=A0A4Q9DP59_9BACL|nr:glycosyltransferase family 2 protein [Paenibacillus thalictri]
MLTRNRVDLTARCVESVIRHSPEGEYEFIFVDNGSTDGTLSYLETVPQSRLIANVANQGFAAGNNQGMAAARGTHILLLNNDTIVTPEWFSGLHSCLERDPSIGIAGPVSDNVAPIQRIQTPPFRSMDELNATAYLCRAQNKGAGFYSHKLIGFCMLFHQSLLDKIGGFDERFFPGNYEDDDFSIRARIAGKRLWVAQDVFIHHEGQGTFRSDGVDYRLSTLANAEKFREKWNIGLSAFEISQHGYNPSDIVARESFFIPERHYEPLTSQTLAPDGHSPISSSIGISFSESNSNTV